MQSRQRSSRPHSVRSRPICSICQTSPPWGRPMIRSPAKGCQPPSRQRSTRPTCSSRRPTPKCSGGYKTSAPMTRRARRCTRRRLGRCQPARAKRRRRPAQARGPGAFGERDTGGAPIGLATQASARLPSPAGCPASARGSITRSTRTSCSASPRAAAHRASLFRTGRPPARSTPITPRSTAHGVT